MRGSNAQKLVVIAVATPAATAATPTATTATATIVGSYLFLNIFINYYCDYLSSEGVTMVTTTITSFDNSYFAKMVMIITCIYSSYFIRNYGIILNTIMLMQIIFYLNPQNYNYFNLIYNFFDLKMDFAY